MQKFDLKYYLCSHCVLKYLSNMFFTYPPEFMCVLCADLAIFVKISSL